MKTCYYINLVLFINTNKLIEKSGIIDLLSLKNANFEEIN